MSGTRALNNAFNAALSDSRSPGVVDGREASNLINIASEGSARTRARTRRALEDLLTGNPTSFRPGARDNILRFLSTGAVDRPSSPTGEQVLIDWRASKPTWHCHWFPMRESKPGGDPTNNLFAPGGSLDKYDQAFGTESRQYELENNFRAVDSDAEDAGWAGHCNNASEVACLLQEPKHGVKYNGVEFSRDAICGLVVMISDRLASRVDFEGNRYDGPSDDQGDPAPHVFLDVLRSWTAEDKAFVMDIDRKEPVWNYPYDQVKVTESSSAPSRADTSAVPSGGKTKYYHFDLKGTGFEDEARNYRAWINTSPSGRVTSGWLENGDRKVNPDFLWRSHPNPGRWRGAADTNPHVLAENVYEIYRRSIT